jgi:hypothetical protein
MVPAYNTIRQLDPFHLTVGAGFARNKGQNTDSQISADAQAGHASNASLHYLHSSSRRAAARAL